LVKECLAGGRKQQVISTNNFADALGGIVYDYGKLISGDVIAPPDHKVPKVDSRGEPDQPVYGVVELDAGSVRHSEAPVHTGWLLVAGRGTGSRAPTGGEDWLGIVVGMRCLRGSANVAPGTVAGVDGVSIAQSAPGL